MSSYSVKSSKANKASKPLKTVMDTMYITPKILAGWTDPPFQRPLKINEKVKALAEELKSNGGFIPGVITLGVLKGETYLLDGQHRRESFILSECVEGMAYVRTMEFETMAEMGQEFVNLNQQMVRLKPDDILRGLEAGSEGVSLIRKRHPWVGYNMINRGPSSPILSMSALLKCWFGSDNETPSMGGGTTAPMLAERLGAEEAELLSEFLKFAMTAWGKDKTYSRLWNNLNLTLCMWLWRKMVLSAYSAKVGRMSKEQFTKCMMALSSDATYLDWLYGKQLRDTDRSPAFRRIKAAFAKRIEDDTGKKPLLPSPEWSKGH